MHVFCELWFLAILLQHGDQEARGDVKYLPTATVLCGALLVGTTLNADEPIAVSVRPAVTVARGTAQLKISVEPNDQNRALIWEVDGPGYYRSSAAQLNGAGSPRNWYFFVKDLEQGEYQVRAVVRRTNQSEAIARTSLVVMAGKR